MSIPETPVVPAAAQAADPTRPRRGRLARFARSALVSLICLAIGLCVFIVLFAVTLQENGDALPVRLSAVLFVDLVVGVLANLAAGFLRGAGLWNLLLVVPGAISGSAVPAAAVGLARIGARRDLRVDAFGVGLSVITALLSGATYRWAEHEWSSTLLVEMLLSAVFATAALLWGRVRGTREALIGSLRRQASTAHREREALEREHRALAREHSALVAQAESEQRASIARDMHDSLSHHLSLIAMHAGALSYRADMPPAQMREVAATIQDDARAANTELRHVLSALRTDDAEPLPTGSRLLELVALAQDEGQQVDLTWHGTDAHDIDAAGSAVVVTLARIVRELLTNARKHAPGSPLHLEIAHEEGMIRLLASNPVPGSSDVSGSLLGAGLGLTGVRERVRLLGGTTRAEIREHSIFEVEVHLPWSDHRPTGKDPR